MSPQGVASLIGERSRSLAAELEADARRGDRPGAGPIGRTELEAALDRALSLERDGSVVAVLLVEVGGIARLDSLLGHEAGDRTASELAGQLEGFATAGDTLAELGTGRFALLRGSCAGEAEATRLAEDIVDAIREPRYVDELAVRLTVNVGVALATRARARNLLRDGEIALQSAKERGPNRVEAFRPAIRQRVARQLETEAELSLALERDELELEFQPIVSLGAPGLFALETLVRWRHPRRGRVLPGLFVPAAEDGGLIVDVGNWVLDEVCALLDRWTAEDPSLSVPRVAINVSARQLSEGTLAERLSAALVETGVPASSIVLEIGESSAVEAGEGSVEVLDEVKRLGVEVLLDDFGAGYSSLAQLARLPIDGIKLDRAFVDELGALTDPEPILQAVVAMARALELTVVAEGIETQGQLDGVRSLGIDAVQGFLLARPASARSAADVRRLIEAAGASPLTQPSDATSGDLVRLGDAAEILGISASTLRRLTARGELPAVRTEGGHRRYRRDDVVRFARRRLGGVPRLRQRELPPRPLPATAAVLDDVGGELVDQARTAMYDPLHPGWFATPQGGTRSGSWIASYASALAGGHHRAAIELTVAYLESTMLAGASPAECVRFVTQVAAAIARELARSDAPGREVRELQKLTAATTEAFLERLRR